MRRRQNQLHGSRGSGAPECWTLRCHPRHWCHLGESEAGLSSFAGQLTWRCCETGILVLISLQRADETTWMSELVLQGGTHGVPVSFVCASSIVSQPHHPATAELTALRNMPDPRPLSEDRDGYDLKCGSGDFQVEIRQVEAFRIG